jgi:aminoglycoside phosphotransferase (APT) family kinase protein
VNEFVPTPPAEVVIDADLVSSLLSAQHPDLAELPLGDRYEGWDNVTWRLGDDLAVRLPRRAIASTMVATELAWLPRIGKNWPFRAPLAQRIGEPSSAYPWRWSIVPWIDGHLAFDEPLSTEGARDLGRALRALHQPAPADAPINPFRSTPLASRITRAAARLQALVGQADSRPPGERMTIDAEAAEDLMHHAARGPRPDLVCAHLDIHGENVITDRGRLAGIIDWGDAGAGDRATDLGQAYVLLGPARWRTMLSAYGETDRATRERAKAEAIGYAVTLATMTDGPYPACGWRALESLGVATPAT